MKHKTFKQFKSEIIKRCIEHSVSKLEINKILTSNTFAELIPILTANFYMYCMHHIFADNLLLKVDAKNINNYDLYCNVSTDRGYLFVSGSVNVFAFDSAIVFAFDKAIVKATVSATVFAFDSAIVYAYDSATVFVFDSAIVFAYDSAHICSHNSIEHELNNESTCKYY